MLFIMLYMFLYVYLIYSTEHKVNEFIDGEKACSVIKENKNLPENDLKFFFQDLTLNLEQNINEKIESLRNSECFEDIYKAYQSLNDKLQDLVTGLDCSLIMEIRKEMNELGIKFAKKLDIYSEIMVNELRESFSTIITKSLEDQTYILTTDLKTTIREELGQLKKDSAPSNNLTDTFKYDLVQQLRCENYEFQRSLVEVNYANLRQLLFETEQRIQEYISNNFISKKEFASKPKNDNKMINQLLLNLLTTNKQIPEDLVPLILYLVDQENSENKKTAESETVTSTLNNFLGSTSGVNPFLQ